MTQAAEGTSTPNTTSGGMLPPSRVDDSRARGRVGLGGPVIALTLVLLATALRAYHIDWQSLWDDDGFTAWAIGKDLLQITAQTPTGNAPLHYYAIAGWANLAGDSEFALRYLSLWFGVLLVPMTAALASRMFGRPAGVVAALLMAVSPPFIYQSQSVRPYTLLTAIYLASLLIAWRIVEQPGARRLWLAFGTTAALGSIAHFYGLVIPLLALVLFAPRARRDRRFRYGLLATGAMVIVPLSLWAALQLSANLAYAQGYARWGDGAVFSESVARAKGSWVGLWAQTGYGLDVGPEHAWTLLPLGLSLCGLILFCRSRRAGRRIVFLTYFLVSAAAGVLGAAAFNTFNPRYLLFLGPLSIALVAGVAELPLPRRPFVGMILACLLLVPWLPLLAQYYTPPEREDLRSISRRVIAESRGGDGLIVNSGWRATLVDHYFRRSSGLPRYTVPMEATPDEEAVRSALRGFSANHDRFWLISFGAPEGSAIHRLGAVLSEDFARVYREAYGTTQLSLYVRNAATSEPSIKAVFEDKVELVVGAPRWPRGGGPLNSVLIPIEWRPLRPLQQDYAASLRLIDDRDTVWAQADSGPRNGYVRTSGKGPSESWQELRGLQVPVGTPPGVYGVTLTLYEAASGRPLQPTTPRTAPRQALAVGQVEVHAAPSPPNAVLPRLRAMGTATFGREVKLLGGQWPDWHQAGRVMQAVLYWQANAEPSGDYGVELKLRDRAGGIAAAYRGAPTRDSHPTSRWRSGEIIAGRFPLRIHPLASPGRHRLALSLFDQRSGRPLAVDEGSEIVLGEVEVTARPPGISASPAQRLVGMGFGSGISLVGYSLLGEQGELLKAEAPLFAGQDVRVLLFWRWQGGTATESGAIDRSLTAFVHLLDAGGKLVAQHDGIPAEGERPTTGWAPGEMIVDPHLVVVPPGMPAGRHRLIAGIYDSATIRRLSTDSGADHVDLGGLAITTRP